VLKKITEASILVDNLFGCGLDFYSSLNTSGLIFSRALLEFLDVLLSSFSRSPLVVSVPSQG
jgi:hypothetical protein